MPQELDYEGIFGNNTYEERLMPIVYIDRVLLENNSVPARAEENPHIQAYSSLANEKGELEYKQGNPESSRLGSGCLATVSLVVKDVLDNSSLSSWFYDAELLKYMQVKVVQSTSKELTNSLIKGNMSALGLRKNKNFHTDRDWET